MENISDQHSGKKDKPERSGNHKEKLVVCIEGPQQVTEGETAHLNGTVKFHPSIKNLKWQKKWKGKFRDINIHKQKYKGSRNDYWNPILEIHDFDIEDESGYRLRVYTWVDTTDSNEHKIKLLRISESKKKQR
uniref:Uncharacterized protein LOC111110680 n=1 Tax=Crassostrea virginica TaxID=6565 RepID=A0A8B8BHZ7_CRAVI|nr:uncharacterized protein LOC111110680 [Crassostrea virginica]